MRWTGSSNVTAMTSSAAHIPLLKARWPSFIPVDCTLPPASRSKTSQCWMLQERICRAAHLSVCIVGCHQLIHWLLRLVAVQGSSTLLLDRTWWTTKTRCCNMCIISQRKFHPDRMMLALHSASWTSGRGDTTLLWLPDLWGEGDVLRVLCVCFGKRTEWAMSASSKSVRGDAPCSGPKYLIGCCIHRLRYTLMLLDFSCGNLTFVSCNRRFLRGHNHLVPRKHMAAQVLVLAARVGTDHVTMANVRTKLKPKSKGR